MVRRSKKEYVMYACKSKEMNNPSIALQLENFLFRSSFNYASEMIRRLRCAVALPEVGDWGITKDDAVNPSQINPEKDIN